MKIKHFLICAALATSASSFAAKPAALSETLASGVVVEHSSPGTGAHPAATDTVKVHYRGTLLNGTEFDSSYKRGTPISFPLNRVIACWTEGVQKIAVGGKARLTCPANTAYGSAGAGDSVPPNSVLIFDIELIAIGK